MINELQQTEMEVSPGAETVSYAGSEGNDNGLGIREVSHGPGPSQPIETQIVSNLNMSAVSLVILSLRVLCDMLALDSA